MDATCSDPLANVVLPLLLKQLDGALTALLHGSAPDVDNSCPGRAYHSEILFPDSQAVVDIEEILRVCLVQSHMPASGQIDEHHGATQCLNGLRLFPDSHHVRMMPRIIRPENNTCVRKP